MIFSHIYKIRDACLRGNLNMTIKKIFYLLILRVGGRKRGRGSLMSPLTCP